MKEFDNITEAIGRLNVTPGPARPSSAADKKADFKERKKSREEEKLEKKRLKEQLREEERQKRLEKKKKKSKGAAANTYDKFAQSETNPIPLIVEKCIIFIEEEGLDSEGIYRVPGNRAHVDLLFQKFDEGKKCVASKLKQDNLRHVSFPFFLLQTLMCLSEN